MAAGMFAAMMWLGAAFHVPAYTGPLSNGTPGADSSRIFGMIIAGVVCSILSMSSVRKEARGLFREAGNTRFVTALLMGPVPGSGRLSPPRRDAARHCTCRSCRRRLRVPSPRERAPFSFGTRPICESLHGSRRADSLPARAATPRPGRVPGVAHMRLARIHVSADLGEVLSVTPRSTAAQVNPAPGRLP